ncbi:MAG: peptide chain release factor N(5)-glutamine methyltransferase [Clostridia bacterium]|nr:peptide chain release factor N(5)-glutamine methyltransferase [Clostridia bacterium]
MTIKEFFTANNKRMDKNQARDFAWLLVERLKAEPIEWGAKPITTREQTAIKKEIKRLLAGEPLGQILGFVPFLDCEIKVTKDVLIPRSETEQLCEIIINEHEGVPTRILDICTGSGCIAVALAKNLPAYVLATDISEDAVSVARQNALANLAQVDFVVGDLCERVEGVFDVIVSNPPYLNKREMDTLPQSVKDYEPHLALFGGDDGLDFYRRLVEVVPKHLNSGGVVYLEVGDTQADQVAEIFSHDFDCRIVADYYGFDRFVIARSKK